MTQSVRLGCAHPGKGPETNQPGGAKQDDWPEQRQRPRKLPPYKGFGFFTTVAQTVKHPSTVRETWV